MILTLGSGFASAESANEPVNYTIDTPYDYPVRPGMPEWAEFTDHQQMIDACEIPENILCAMTTEALVETVLDYPLFIDPYAFNNVNHGFESISNTFNGVKELMTRDDASTILLEKYQNAIVLTPFAARQASAKEYFYLSNIELMMAQPVFYNKLSISNQIKFDNIAEEKYAEKSQFPNEYNIILQSTYYYALSQQQGIKLYVQGDTLSTTHVYTPRGTPVLVERKQEWDAMNQTGATNYFNSTYPNATRIGIATYNYNCHSYAWYSASTSNIYWMNDPRPYQQDGSYTAYSSARANDKITYNTLTHSGIITSVSSSGPWSTAITERSKWGAYGLYSHKAVSYTHLCMTSSA